MRRLHPLRSHVTEAGQPAGRAAALASRPRCNQLALPLHAASVADVWAGTSTWTWGSGLRCTCLLDQVQPLHVGYQGGCVCRSSATDNRSLPTSSRYGSNVLRPCSRCHRSPRHRQCYEPEPDDQAGMFVTVCTCAGRQHGAAPGGQVGARLRSAAPAELWRGPIRPEPGAPPPPSTAASLLARCCSLWVCQIRTLHGCAASTRQTLQAR
jgi:hypothetical protein